jgi:hypothetical protein
MGWKVQNFGKFGHKILSDRWKILWLAQSDAESCGASNGGHRKNFYRADKILRAENRNSVTPPMDCLGAMLGDWETFVTGSHRRPPKLCFWPAEFFPTVGKFCARYCPAQNCIARRMKVVGENSTERIKFYGKNIGNFALFKLWEIIGRWENFVGGAGRCRIEFCVEWRLLEKILTVG